MSSISPVLSLTCSWNALCQRDLTCGGRGEAGGFFHSRDGLAAPDIQIHVMAASMDLEYLNRYQGLRLDKDPGMASNPCQLRPESRGSIHAASVPSL